MTTYSGKVTITIGGVELTGFANEEEWAVERVDRVDLVEEPEPAPVTEESIYHEVRFEASK